MKKSTILIIVGIILLNAIVFGSYFTIKHIKDNQNKQSTTTKETNNKSSDEINLNNESYEITKGGTYSFAGSIKDGSITTNTSEEVTIILNSVEINNSKGSCISILGDGSTVIKLVGENKLTDGETYSNEDIDSVIYSNADLVIKGDGSLEINANYKDAISSKTSLEIDSGTYNINAVNKAVRSITTITINGGTFNIRSEEGIESTYIVINDGTYDISASDDGINASDKSDFMSPTIEINGGNITINMDQGDTDALDSNGYLYINGGTLNINAESPFDWDIEGKLNGGTVIVNGETVTELTNQFAGEGEGGPGGPEPR